MIMGWLTNSFRFTYNHNNGYNVCSSIFMQTRDYAARKGTREKARKKKVKAVVEKVGFVLHKRREKIPKITVSPLTTIDDSWKRKAIDNVWITKYHQQPIYSLQEAIQCHHESHHPTILNKPHAPISAFVELDMKREKKNKFVEKFTRVVDTPHIFKYGESTNKVLVMCKNAAGQKDARDAGADFVGGVELIKQIQNGAFVFKEYNHIVAHADILAELLLIRGLLRKKFPNIKSGTLSTDVGKLVTKFKHGIQYTAIPHEVHKDYGQINIIFGLLDMDMKQLEENFAALINDIESNNPRSEGLFIQRVKVTSDVSGEALKVDFQQFLPKIQQVEEPVENAAIIPNI